MNLSFKFTDMDELKKVYDPIVVEKAAYATIKQLQGRAATEVSKAIRKQYRVTASGIKSALTQRIRMDGGVPVGLSIYLGKRFSLRHFATGNRVRVKTARGIRYGAKARVRNDERAQLVPGGFFGTAKDSGSGQIFQRFTNGKKMKSKPKKAAIKKLTAPSISQMVRGGVPINAVNDLMQHEADAKFSNNLDHFMQKKTGLR